jgi:hypothetical protein
VRRSQPKGLVVAVFLMVAATACSSSSTAAKGASTAAGGTPSLASSSAVSALTVTEAPVPPLPVPDYKTEGTFPRVGGTGISLTAVNVGITNALERDQQKYALVARQEEAADPGPSDPSDPGVYGMYPDPKLISASSVVVSALIPDTELFPGGTDSNGWLGVTVQVPSGSPVTIDQILDQPGLSALAAAAKAIVLLANSCVKAGVDDPAVGVLNAAGFEPTAQNYGAYALLPGGLAVGFRDEQVGSPACGSSDAVVPYAVVEPYLSTLGRTLVAGVRAPQR